MPKDLSEENAALQAELEHLRLRAGKARLERELGRDGEVRRDTFQAGMLAAISAAVTTAALLLVA